MSENMIQAILAAAMKASWLPIDYKAKVITMGQLHKILDRFLKDLKIESITIIDDKWQVCNDCGAIAQACANLKHHDTCIRGCSMTWKEYYDQQDEKVKELVGDNHENYELVDGEIRKKTIEGEDACICNLDPEDICPVKIFNEQCPIHGFEYEEVVDEAEED